MSTPSVRPLTCGARIPVTEATRRLGYQAAPGTGGISLFTAICALSVHGPGSGHAGVVRRLVGQPRTTVWACWADTAPPSCTAWEDCPNTGGGIRPTACRLFTGHDGPCTFDVDSTPAADTFRVHRIEKALQILTGHTHHDYATVWEAGHDATLLSWDELRARRIWEHLPEWDQVSVFRAISQADVPWRAGPGRDAVLVNLVRETTRFPRLWATSTAAALPAGTEAATLWKALTRLPHEWQAVVLAKELTRQGRHSSLEKAVRAAAGQAAAGRHPGEPETRGRSHGDEHDERDWDEHDERQYGTAEAGRLSRLPHAWQVDAVRRAMLRWGPLSANTAAIAINRLRSYDIHPIPNGPVPL